MGAWGTARAAKRRTSPKTAMCSRLCTEAWALGRQRVSQSEVVIKKWTVRRERCRAGHAAFKRDVDETVHGGRLDGPGALSHRHSGEEEIHEAMRDCFARWSDILA